MADAVRIGQTTSRRIDMPSVESRIAYFFAEVGVFDYFGPAACQRIADSGVESIREVFGLTESDFESMGFPKDQAARLTKDLRESRYAMVDQGRLLQAIGAGETTSYPFTPKATDELPDEVVDDAIFLMRYFKERTLRRPHAQSDSTTSQPNA